MVQEMMQFDQNGEEYESFCRRVASVLSRAVMYKVISDIRDRALTVGDYIRVVERICRSTEEHSGTPGRGVGPAVAEGVDVRNVPVGVLKKNHVVLAADILPAASIVFLIVLLVILCCVIDPCRDHASSWGSGITTFYIYRLTAEIP
jgi:hypothetical protein